MDTLVNPYLARITVKAGVRSGRPCVRDTRITVQEILKWLAAGATEEEILADYANLSPKLAYRLPISFPDLFTYLISPILGMWMMPLFRRMPGTTALASLPPMKMISRTL